MLSRLRSNFKKVFLKYTLNCEESVNKSYKNLKYIYIYKKNMLFEFLEQFGEKFNEFLREFSEELVKNWRKNVKLFWESLKFWRNLREAYCDWFWIKIEVEPQKKFWRDLKKSLNNFSQILKNFEEM